MIINLLLAFVFSLSFEVTPQTRCLYWNPSPWNYTVIADFYIDGQHYTRHDGDMYGWDIAISYLRDDIPDLPPHSQMVLSAPQEFYAWCWDE